jgi:hypothetical protein
MVPLEITPDTLRTHKLRLTLVEHLREKFDPFEGCHGPISRTLTCS